MNEYMESTRTLVFLRGLGREQAHWGAFLSRCQRQLSDWEIHCLDLPGCGELYRQVSPLSIKSIRRQLQFHCLEKQIEDSFILVAMSMGGMVALDWLAADPEQVFKVVIINSSSSDVPMRSRLLSKARQTLRRAFFAAVEEREAMILQLVSRRFANDHTVLSRWIEIQRRQPVKRETILRQLLAAARYKAPYQLGADKGIVLCSEQDELAALECSEILAERYDWPCLKHPDAGHDLPLDDPQWVVEQLARFLAKR